MPPKKNSTPDEPALLRTSADVLAAMRLRYTAPEYALFEEVGNATGGGASRRADALVMGLWPSRGLDLHGFEIKVSRTDVVRELRDPRKAEAIATYCDFWWLVVGSASIVKLEEVPANWGLIVPVGGPKGTTLRTVKEAKRLEPKAIDKKFLAALLRRVSETFGSEQMRRTIYMEVFNEASQRAEASVKADHDRELGQLQRSLDAANAKNAELSAALAAATKMPTSPEVLRSAFALLTHLGGHYGMGAKARTCVNLMNRIVDTIPEIRSTLEEVVQLSASLQEPAENTPADDAAAEGER